MLVSGLLGKLKYLGINFFILFSMVLRFVGSIRADGTILLLMDYI